MPLLSIIIKSYILIQMMQNSHEQNLDFHPSELNVVVEQKEPLERVVSLNNNHNVNDIRNNEDDMLHKTKLIGKLKDTLHLKIGQIKQAKKRIADCKQKIKQIGEEVDKEMNKSFLRHSKPHAVVNIKQIFKGGKSADPQINELTEELTRVRAEAKRVKSEMKILEGQMMGPIAVMNIQRATQLKIKTKQVENELKKIKQERDYLEAQIKMMETEEVAGDYSKEEQIKGNKEKNNQILIELKEEKSIMYELEKQDRILTEKIRYLQDLQDHIQIRKSKSSVVPALSKEEAEYAIKQLTEEIRQVLQKRNKVQNQRKLLYKSLQNETVALQAKNWEIINKLRDIDAKLIKHYNSKLKKGKNKKDNSQQATTIIQDQIKTKENSGPATIRTLYEAKNDKNVQPISFENETIVMVEKRKNYDFFMSPSENQTLGNIILTDEILGNKLTLKRLSFFIDEQLIYGISAEYLNEKKNEVRGYKIIPKIRPKDVVNKTLIIDLGKNEVINFVHVGVDKNDFIKFLHIVTSETKQFKWGDLDNCERNQQKNIRKYENFVLKGKLNQIGEKEAPNYYCLGGLGFTVLYLSPK